MVLLPAYKIEVLVPPKGVVKAEELILNELFRDTHAGIARITLGRNVSDGLTPFLDLQSQH